MQSTNLTILAKNTTHLIKKPQSCKQCYCSFLTLLNYNVHLLVSTLSSLAFLTFILTTADKVMKYEMFVYCYISVVTINPNEYSNKDKFEALVLPG